MQIYSIERIRLLYVRAWNAFYPRHRITDLKKVKIRVCERAVRGICAFENSCGMWCNVIGEWFLTFGTKSFLDSWEKAPRLFESLGATRAGTQRNILEDLNLRLRHYENPKSRMSPFVLVDSLEMLQRMVP
jgi:hypothetical protein